MFRLFAARSSLASLTRSHKTSTSQSQLLDSSPRFPIPLPPLSSPLLSRSLSTAPTRSPQARISSQDGKVEIELPNGTSTSFSPMWLRDHCREERSYHPSTRQRLVDTCKIPIDLKPTEVKVDLQGLHVTWPESSFESSYQSFYPWSFLFEHSYNPPLLRREDLPTNSSSKVLWDNSIASNLPTVTYSEVMESELGVYEWVKRIDTYGFSFISGIPPTPEATEELIRRIAFIRETHYGGFWDFTSNLEHGDLAYSDVRLEAHTDTTYFTDPCGLQLFHLLSPSTSHKGGHNLLVDGFKAAQLLRQSHPSIYSLLSTLRIPSHASGSGSNSIPSGVHMRASHTVLQHDPSSEELTRVRWNGDDRAVLGGEGFGGDKMEEWYEALRVWEGILRSREMQLWTEMKMGTAIIFDNTRVLHGRSGYEGERRLCGAYINGDDYRSRLRGLAKQFGGVSRREEVVRERMKSLGVDRGTGKGAWEGY